LLIMHSAALWAVASIIYAALMKQRQRRLH
jgi:hypothetical protein